MIISNRNIYNNFLKKYKGCFSLQKDNYFLKINKVEERLNFEEYFLPNVKHNDLKILFFIDFNKFTAAWSSLNRKLPNYPFEIESVNSFLDERIKLEHSLNLDKFNSREELLSYAQKYYKKLKYKSLKDLIFKKIKSIIKKILNKGN